VGKDEWAIIATHRLQWKTFRKNFVIADNRQSDVGIYLKQ